MNWGRLALTVTIVTVAACSKAYRPKTNANPISLQQRLIGYWELSGKLDAANLGNGTPTRLKFTEGGSASESHMESCNDLISCDVLVSVQNTKVVPTMGRVSAPCNTAWNITRVDGKKLVLNQSLVYRRILPSQEMSVSSDSSPLCEKEAPGP